MGKSKHKISNWKQYNQALVQRGSLTVWMDEQAIQQWHCQTHHGRRGRGFHYSDSAIETALMLKAVFKLPLRALEGFINSLFQLMNVPLQSPDYSCISKRAKTVEIKYRLPSHGPVAHLVIDATGLKVYGEGEWKIRKHGKSPGRRCGDPCHRRSRSQPGQPKSAWKRWAITRCCPRCSTPCAAR